MPDFAEGYFNLGLALEQNGQLDEAHIALEKALRLKPGLRGANLFLGLIAYKENRYRDAEVNLLRETQIDPKNAKAFMWLGVCRLAEDDPQAAIAPLDKAYALDPKDVDILYHRGRAYLLVANASYDAMFNADRDSMRVHQVLGEAYGQAYRTPEAIQQFELAIRMAPHQPGLHEELGDQFWIAGQLDKAEEAYRADIEIDPHSITARYKLGSLLVQSNNPTEGVKWLRAALQDDPSLSDAHYYLAKGLQETGNDQEAVAEYRLAIAADPSNDRAMTSYYKLSRIYRNLHQDVQAQEAMNNFQRMRSDIRERQEKHTAQIARRRAELPVADPEMQAIASSPDSAKQ